MTLLEVQDLSCERGDRELFTRLNFALAAGAMIQIEGRNGAGKTSLLRILCGLTAPSGGTVQWRGHAIQRQWLAFRAEVLYLGHQHGVKGTLTPVENLQIACGLGASHPNVTIRAALQQVGLGRFYDHPCHGLSAGQQRRVALARLLATSATLWILDEPFTALDRAGVALVEALLHAHLSAGGAAVITTHQPIRMDNYPVQGLNLDH